ncbi:extracellular solute-binding protein [Microlunatus parietis]|uniref:Putative aldouronate transport system substrate-binding protein n=1 Tax=Microlunatus parietis TaxID=682979 RepID=A0A7Y9I9A6_9ACTN|nr:extracellular solute-binding protein [Microlunatus parietis]NYE72620.1 putative aldouronate transport system substrate-binding protein [Microlunatus parietis]
MINESLPQSRLSRRGVLGLGAGLAALAGCRTQPKDPAPGSEPTARFVAPNYVPPDQVPGAMISDIDGVSPAYSQYPSEQAKSVTETPGSGAEVSTFQVLFQAPPPTNNPWLTEFERRLGAKINATFGAGDAYGQKVQTLMASGDLPDICFVERSAAPSVVKPMQQGAFTDLSELLAGSGIDAYPNLARLPTYAWKNSSINGRILGVPRALPLVNGVTMYRADWAADLGLAEPPKNAEEVKELLVGFTKGDHRGKSKGDCWGLATLGNGVSWAMEMFRVPNDWRLNDDGTLTNVIETDEYEAAINWLVELWKAGAFHPDAATLPTLDSQDLFMSGRIGLMPAGIAPHYRSMVPTLRKNDPSAEVVAVSPPGHDGGDPVVHQGGGYFGIAAIPSEVGKDQARLAELLRVINYWCAPFGSEEHTFINYGIEGRHFTYDDRGTPIAVDGDRPLTEVAGPSFLVQPLEAVFFFPGDDKAATEAQQAIAKAVPLSIENPVRSLISETDIRQSAALGQLTDDYLFGIITGRRPISQLAEWRERWRSRGGDTIRKEFEAGLA